MRQLLRVRNGRLGFRAHHLSEVENVFCQASLVDPTAAQWSKPQHLMDGGSWRTSVNGLGTQNA